MKEERIPLRDVGGEGNGFERRKNLIALKNSVEIVQVDIYLGLKKQMSELYKVLDSALEGNTEGFPKWLAKIGEGITVYPLFPGHDGFELYEKGQISRVKEGSSRQLIKERIETIKEYIGYTHMIIKFVNYFENPIKSFPIGNNKKNNDNV